MRERLIEARGAASRTDVARDLGITPQALGMIERGDRTPRLPLMRRISEYYSKPMDYFFGSFGNESCPEHHTA